MKRRGQAAMEFLMTYGWAILAAIIAIGVLAYFGVFSAGSFSPSAAILSAPLYANAWNVKDVAGAGTDTVNVEVQNNGGTAVTITGIAITNSESGGTTGVCDDSTTGLSFVVNPGSLQTLTVTCTSDISSGDTFKGDLAVTYTQSGGTLPLVSTGTIAGTVSS